MWRGELAAARTELTDLLNQADEGGEAESYFVFRLQLCELATRAGSWNDLATWLREWELHPEEASGSEAALLRHRAMLAAGRGEPDEAHTLAEQSMALSGAAVWHRLESLRARGLAALVQGDPAGAAAHLEQVWQHLQAAEVRDPGAFPVAADLVEALAGSDRVSDAERVADELARVVDTLGHPWGRAALLRARGHLRASDSGSVAVQEAADLFHEAARANGALGCEHEQARCLVHAGIALRRLRRRRDSRETLGSAVRLLTQLGSPGWANWASTELARVSGRRPAGEELTPAESRVADLVAAGLRNREVAERLVITDRTVEATLSRIYTKLGIRSRTELAARMHARITDQSLQEPSGMVRRE